MKTIKLNGKQISIPSSWDELTFGNYEKWYVSKPQNEQEYVYCIAALCGIEGKDLLEESVAIFKDIEKSIKFVLDPDFTPSQILTVDNELYVINLAEEYTIGEQLAIDSVIENETSLSDVLAILCRPLGESFDKEKAIVRAHLFRGQPCSKILPLISFFSDRKNKQNEALDNSSQLFNAATQYLNDTKNFLKRGDAIKRLPKWQRKNV